MRSSVAGIAQLVEQLTCNQKVPSSTLGAGTNLKPQSQDWGFFHLGADAHLFIAISLTATAAAYRSTWTCNTVSQPKTATFAHHNHIFATAV